MSLIDEFMQETGKCVIINRQIVDDGLGGHKVIYTEGAEFNAAIVLNNSIQAKVAEKQGVTGVYTITFPKSLRLQYHDIFKRVSDGQVFRVTDKDDNHTPDSSSLDMRTTTVEEYSLTDEI